MNIAFAGTPEFARAALAALLAADFPAALVLTQPDRPAGRGLRLHASPVKELAQTHGIPVIQPAGLRLDGKYAADAQAAQQALAAVQPDLLIVAAYGLILPPWVLALPRFGCLNIHASLLPRWRGAAPIQRAIEAGDEETGISIMQMGAGLDTGDVLLERRVPIAADATAASLHDELAGIGGELITAAVQRLARGPLPGTPQPDAGATYAHKITKEEAVLDWAQPAVTLERRIRAFNPFPGASSALDGILIKVWCAQVDPADVGAVPAVPGGTILAASEAGIAVACGQGTLRLTELQRAGGKRLPAREFLAGFPLHAGQRFGAAEVAR
jgi:methionyl-tRNA formyltransferase